MNQFRLMKFAVLGHRVSGLVLILFLPVHLAIFGESIRGSAKLEQSLAFIALPWIKPISWALVSLLIIHFSFGVRVLLIEFGPVTSPARLRLAWIGGGMLFALIYTIIYALR